MEITEDIKEISRQIAEIYRKNIIDKDAKATGELSRFTWDCRVENTFFKLDFIMPYYYKYAPENERPKGAKRPPVDAIIEWLKVKKLPVPTTKKGVPNYKGPAYCIARKIQEKGYRYQPRKILQNSLDEAEEQGLFDKLINAITEEVNKELNQEIQTL